MVEEYNYIDIEHAIKTHDMLLAKTGGLSGIKEKGLLDSSLHHIQNDMNQYTKS